ncbi:MAG: hypothetical protein ABEH88_01245 [Halobacteriales archaeon]
MSDTVEYCIGNVDPDARSELRDLDCQTIEKPCLQRCGRCFEGALLVVDGNPRFGESHTDLLGDIEGEV